MEFFLVRIFLYSDWIQENTDQKKLRIWTLFTQCIIYKVHYNEGLHKVYHSILLYEFLLYRIIGILFIIAFPFHEIPPAYFSNTVFPIISAPGTYFEALRYGAYWRAALKREGTYFKATGTIHIKFQNLAIFSF